MNQYLRKMMSAIILSMGCMAIAQATTGPYFVLGGGFAYLSDAELSHTNITSTNLNEFTRLFSITYSEDNAFDDLGRAALGYLVYQSDASHQGAAIEVGFNYFGSIKNTVTNQIVAPIVNVPHTVTTTQDTTTWATDLVGIYRRLLGQSHTTLLVKLGLGYEYMTYRINNSIDGLSGELPSSETLYEDGLGAVVGIGAEYNFSPHFALRAEVDGMKGGKGIGYLQSLAALVFSYY